MAHGDFTSAVAASYRSGVSVHAIAAEHGRSPQNVYTHLKRAGVALQPRTKRTHRPRPGRPDWSYPSDELIAEVHAARREMQAVLNAQSAV
jgi:transposase-like protein